MCIGFCAIELRIYPSWYIKQLKPKIFVQCKCCYTTRALPFKVKVVGLPMHMRICGQVPARLSGGSATPPSSLLCPSPLHGQLHHTSGRTSLNLLGIQHPLQKGHLRRRVSIGWCDIWPQHSRSVESESSGGESGWSEEAREKVAFLQ